MSHIVKESANKSIVIGENQDASKVYHPAILQMRHASKEIWEMLDEILPDGELVFENDDPANPLFKLGDGIHTYTQLGYTAIFGTKGDKGDQGPQGDPGIFVGDTPPSSPALNDLWVDTN